MRNFSAIICLLLFFITANAQKCSYISNTVSGMDGSIQVITEPELFSYSKKNGELQVWSKVHLDSLVVLALSINTPSASTIKEIEQVKIMLENKEVILLQLMNSINPSERKVDKFSIYAVISNHNQKLMLASRSTEVRISSGEDSIVFLPGNKKEAGSIKKVLSCVLDVLPDPY